MAFDQSKIGKLAAELMEQLEARYEEDAEIGDVALLVEIVSPQHASQIATTYTNPRGHVNLGLLEAGRQIILRQIG